MKIHLLGIAGTGMTSLAGMLREQGHEISGSDQGMYPPMSDILNSWQVPVSIPYDSKNVRSDVDLVIIGNVIRQTNPEAQAVLQKGIPYLSMPEAIQRFFLEGKKSLVVAGTHGKTSNTALLAWLLESIKQNPSFFIGGRPKNFKQNFQISDSEYFVLEGDEYDTAFFDKGPKFLHYQPWGMILTGVEFDHADIYRDLEHIRESFRKVIRLIPQGGFLIVNADDPEAQKLAKACAGRVVHYGINPQQKENLDFFAEALSTTDPFCFRVFQRKKAPVDFSWHIPGRHNMSNALACLALLSSVGFQLEAFQAGICQFQGVHRRQDRIGEAGDVLVLDDFAHHPTAVAKTIAAIHEFYPQKRLWAIFEPRSNTSKTNVFQNEYAHSFSGADKVIISQVYQAENVKNAQILNVSQLVETINAENNDDKAWSCENTEQIIKLLVRELQPGDVVLFMSNGDFGGAPRKLLQELQK